MPKVFLKDDETGRDISNDFPINVDIYTHVGDLIFLDGLPFEIKAIHHYISGESYEVVLKVSPTQ